MTAVEKKLEELLDRESIRDLPQLYCEAVWRQDAEALAALFTEDAVVSSEGTGISAAQNAIRGRLAIRNAYTQLGQFGSPRPFCHQIIISELGPDRAKGKVYMELRLGNDNMDYWASNVIEDEYQKINGEWKFSKRHSIMFEHRPAIMG